MHNQSDSLCSYHLTSRPTVRCCSLSSYLSASLYFFIFLIYSQRNRQCSLQHSTLPSIRYHTDCSITRDYPLHWYTIIDFILPSPSYTAHPHPLSLSLSGSSPLSLSTAEERLHLGGEESGRKEREPSARGH